MGTKKYKVKVEQFIEAEVDENTKKKDISLIKKEIKNNPPYVETYGGDITYKTVGRVKIKSVKKVAEYKECSKCKGTGSIEEENYYGYDDTVDCCRCDGSGEVLKRR